MLKEFVSLLFPRNCEGCNTSLNTAEQYLCTECRLNLPYTDDLSHPDNELFRKFAFEPKINFAAAWLYFSTGGLSQNLLHKLKYGNACDLGHYLGTLAATHLEPYIERLAIDFILPVPLHESKKQKRGYNQSECISKGLSEVLDISIEPALVRRVVKTTSQTRKNRVSRWQNIEGIYSAPSQDLSGKNILVVDDVITTGSTVGQLVEQLVKAEANAVSVFCLARGK